MIDTGVMTFTAADRTEITKCFSLSDLKMWSLAFVKLRSQIENTILICDSIGKEVLIDGLQLPFSEYRVLLDDYLPKNLKWIWGASKLYSYSIMDRPFLHIDADTVLNARLPLKVLNADIVTQGKEPFTVNHSEPNCNSSGYYPCLYLQLFRNGPQFIKDNLAKEKHLGYNFGAFGGQDLPLIKEFTKLSFNAIHENAEFWNAYKAGDGHPGIISIFLEQYIFGAIATKYSYPVVCLMDHMPPKVKLGKYIEAPYVHMAGAAKRRPKTQAQISEALQIINPALAKKCEVYAQEIGLSNSLPSYNT